MRFLNRVVRWCAIVATITVAGPVRAQFNAALQGTVSDPSGAAVSGASVNLVEESTGVTKGTVTSPEGFYRISELPPGRYTLTVTANGFQEAVIHSIAVSAEQLSGQDVTLKVGQVSQTVTVSAESQAGLSTEDASIQGTLTSQEVEDLPKFNRDPYELLRLAPGVFGDGARLANGNSAGFPNGPGGNNGSGGTGGSNIAIFQTENQQPISANGQRITANTYLVDGVGVNSLTWGGAALLTPSADSVQEITVISNDYDASDGRGSGAHIKVVTKQGTNSFHGGGFFQYEDPGLNAYNKYNGFDPSTNEITTAKNDDAFRQFGATLGGPLIKDKLFFFFNYEGLRDRDVMFQDQYVDTPQLDQLLLSAHADTPVDTTLSAKGLSPRIAQVLPTDCTLWVMANEPCAVVSGGINIGSPTGSYGQYVYSFGCTASATNPTCPGTVPPNYTGGGLTTIPELVYANIFLPTVTAGNQYNARVDYVVGKNAFSANTFLSFTDLLTSDAEAQGRPMADIFDHRVSPSGFLSWVSTISPTMVNEARFNFTRFAYNELASNPGVNFGIPRTEIQGLPLPGGMRIRYGAQQGDATPGIFAQNTFAFRDMLTTVRGKHGVKFGVDVDRLQDNSVENGNARPDYVFNGFWNFANGTPIYEAIGVNPSTGGPASVKPQYFRSTDIGLFIQDDWKLRHNLTVNVGLRWEYFGPPTEAHGHLENIIPGNNPTTGLMDAVAVLPHQMWNTTWRNFGPRVGFAWSPDWLKSKGVVRGGFGIAFDRFDDVSFENTRDNPPLVANYGICCGTAPGEFGTPFVNGQILYATGATDSPISYPANPALITPINPANNLPTILTGQSAPNVYANPVNMPIPYVYLYSLQVQYALPADWIATIGYSGSSSHDMLRIKNLAFFYPQLSPDISQVFDFTPDTTANFNALNTEVQHRFTHGILANFSYTYSKCLDEMSSEGPGFVTNQTYPIDLATEYGPCDYDATHYANAYAVWDLPIFRERKDLLGKVAGGWQFSPIFTFHSGFPWTPVASNLCPVFGASSLCPVRPTAYLGGAHKEYDTDAFLPPTSAIFPNPSTDYFTLQTTGTTPDFPGIGRNSFRGPRFSQFDMSLAKSFGLPAMKFIGEAGNIELRINAFNIFNKLNLAPFTFGSPSTLISTGQTCTGSGAAQVCTPMANPNFGLASFTNGGLAGRTLELQGRFTF
jgi:Carboxypeptidase regulatory-like domain/TonB dependent receptor